jgi:hypothetical protein
LSAVYFLYNCLSGAVLTFRQFTDDLPCLFNGNF